MNASSQEDGGAAKAGIEDTLRGVGHVHLKVRDVDRSVDFYEDVLALSVSERHDRFAFLSWGSQHHDVALQAVDENADGPDPGVGLYHAAFEVGDATALRTIFENLQQRGVDVSPVDHGISRAMYFDDPDGNGLEVYEDTRAKRDQYEWAGINERFDPSTL